VTALEPESRPSDDLVLPANPPQRRPHRRRLRGLLEWLAVVAVALVAAFLVKTFLLEAFYIPSGSMIPTLEIGDRILVDKLSYDLHAVHRGDIIVFRRPPADTGEPHIKDLVKRVIGLPGETIASRGNQVLIDGHVLREPWLRPGTPLGEPIRPQVIPKGEYFVMGDNRADSADSRVFGPIPRSLIVGRVVAIVWPLSQIRFFHFP
jgi:signal peptidase I